jgi:hypothetical protein
MKVLLAPLLLSALLLVSAQDYKLKSFRYGMAQYHQRHEDLIEKAIRLVESSLLDLKTELGLTLQGEILLEIPPSRRDFKRYLLDAQKEWTVAFAVVRPQRGGGRIVIDPVSAGLGDSPLGATIKHELCHLLLHELTLTSGKVIPKWFNEGLAEWVSGTFALTNGKEKLKTAAIANRLIPLSSLNNSWPLDKQRARLAYLQSVSVVDLIIKECKPRSIRDLIEYLKQGLEFEEALQKTIHLSSSELEAKWQKQFQAGFINLLMLIFVRNILLIFSLVAIVIFFIIRVRYRRRLKRMEEEEKAHKELPKG